MVVPPTKKELKVLVLKSVKKPREAIRKLREQASPKIRALLAKFEEKNRDLEDLTRKWRREPKSLFLLFVLLMALAALGIPSESMSAVEIMNAGLVAVAVTFLLFSIVALPNSAFVRPHPAFWRVVLGASLL